MEKNSSWIVTFRRRFALALNHSLLDLCIVAVSAVVLGMIVAVDLDPQWGIRAGLASLTLTLLPGYVLVAIVYPWNDRHNRDAYQPGYGERAALAFGTSVALLPFLALAPAVFELEYTPLTTLGAVGIPLTVGIPVAAYRRKSIRRPERFRLPVGDWMSRLFGWIGDGNGFRRALRAVMVMSVLLAVVSFGYVLAAPQDGERYSTMTLLSENESSDLVASDYPDDMALGESAELTLALQNDRQRETTYTVVIQLERVDEGDAQEIEMSERLGSFRPTVANGETWTRQHTVTPSMNGEDLRLRYYLYFGEPPEVVGPDTARDYLHVWVDVGSA